MSAFPSTIRSPNFSLPPGGGGRAVGVGGKRLGDCRFQPPIRIPIARPHRRSPPPPTPPPSRGRGGRQSAKDRPPPPASGSARRTAARRARCGGPARRSRCGRSAAGSRRPRALARSPSPGRSRAPRARSRPRVPTGPPPTITGPSAIAIPASLQSRIDLGPAEEPLAATHQRTGSTTQAVEIGRRDRSRQRRVDLAAGDPLAEADDPAEVGVALDQLTLLVGARPNSPMFGIRRLLVSGSRARSSPASAAPPAPTRRSPASR